MGMSWGGEYHLESDWTARASVRYSDFLVAKSLIGVLDQWYSGLVIQRIKPTRTSLLERFDEKFLYSEDTNWFSTVYLPILLSILTIISISRYDAAREFVSSGLLDQWTLLFALIFVFCSAGLSMTVRKARDNDYERKVPLAAITDDDRLRDSDYLTTVQTAAERRVFWNRTIVIEISAVALASVVALVWSLF